MMSFLRKRFLPNQNPKSYLKGNRVCPDTERKHTVMKDLKSINQK